MNDTSDNQNQEVPNYLKDEYITKYVIGRNHQECIMNLFKLHNESVNAWTMIVSYISVLLIIIYIFIRTQFNKLYSLVFLLHLMAHTIHTPFSVGYHTFGNINKEEFIKWRKYDIYTIFLRCIIMTFTLSFFTYKNFLYVLLNTSITLTFVYYALLKFKESEDKHEPLNKYQQGLLIGSVAFTTSIPILYKIIISVITKSYTTSFKIALTAAIFYIISYICYSFQIPERFFPKGVFNEFGNSHNVMHFAYIITSICEILYVYINAKEGNYIKSFK